MQPRKLPLYLESETQAAPTPPCFEHADAVLLYWRIEKTTISTPLMIIHSTDVEQGLSTLEVQIMDRTGDSLLSIQIPSNNTSSYIATVPAKPHSASPRFILIKLSPPRGYYPYHCPNCSTRRRYLRANFRYV